MTDERMRIAMAEALGRCDPPDCTHEPKHRFWNPDDGCCYDAPPDYPKDLNAMHAVEAGLPGHQMIRYQFELSKVGEKNPHVACWDLIHATARQRAEAFLRTIGKWEDDK